MIDDGNNAIAREVVLATRNRGKLEEIRILLAPFGILMRPLDDFPEVPEIVEDGDTFHDNVRKKARTVARLTGRLAIADDSGLVVDALDGRPGVHSARYAGPDATDADRVAKLLEELRDVPEAERGAAFVCVAGIVTPDGREDYIEGRCEGLIAFEPRGSGGFGYDPVFFYPPFGKTFGELDLPTKNRVSHRARALAGLTKLLPTYLPPD